MVFPISTLHDLEQSFDKEKQHVWFLNYWWLSIIFSIIYYVVIFGGRAWMEHRPKFDLRYPLVIWSSCLAVFSILGARITIQHFIQFVSAEGWHGVMCNDDIFFDGKIGFWVWLMVLSKALELIDTVFVVLRKQKLIFLHWYHHIITLIYGWYGYRDLVAPIRVYVTINYSVHALMYSYYALRATGQFKIPRQVNVTITLLQMIQMIVGCFVNAYTFLQLRAGNKCDNLYANIIFSSIVYFTFFVLFVNFFYQSYFKPPKKVKHRD